VGAWLAGYKTVFLLGTASLCPGDFLTCSVSKRREIYATFFEHFLCRILHALSHSAVDLERVGLKDGRKPNPAGVHLTTRLGVSSHLQGSVCMQSVIKTKEIILIYLCLSWTPDYFLKILWI
jgi:hypothetical protein